MKKKNFYNEFHKNASLQKRIINKKNFTYRIAIEIIDKIIEGRNCLNILDYGCGVGALSFYLASLGNDVVGLDISERAIAVACQNALSIKLLSGSIRFFNLEEAKKEISGKLFDLIVCIEVVEHIKEDKMLIKFFEKKLKRGGHLILSTPSREAPLFKHGLTTSFDKVVGHLRRYKPESLVELFCGTNFVIQNIIKTEGIIRNSLFLSPFLGRIIRFIKGPFSDLVTIFDNISLKIFGESNIYLIAQKR